MQHNIEFINTEEGKYLDYYMEKYEVRYLTDLFNRYWESKNFFNGAKIGVSNIVIDSKGKLKVYYFRTDYKTAMFVRQFLYQLEDEGKLKLDEEDYRCNMGYEVLLRDDKHGIFSKRKNDWYGNNKDNHYILTASEGLEESDAISITNKGDTVYQRALLEEIGVSLPSGLETQLGYVIGRNTVLYIEVYVSNIYNIESNLTNSIDTLTGVEDIVGCDILEIDSLEYNSAYSTVLNNYILGNVIWLR